MGEVYRARDARLNRDIALKVLPEVFATDSDRLARFKREAQVLASLNGRWQVSTAGGTRPAWALSGREMFYAAPTGALMRVGVERAPSWEATTPTLLVKEGYFTVPGGNRGRTYDISPDGQRFLMIKEGGSEQAAVPQIIVAQNWDQELKRLVPTR
jgi:serine/threonine protein kinase